MTAVKIQEVYHKLINEAYKMLVVERPGRGTFLGYIFNPYDEKEKEIKILGKVIDSIEVPAMSPVDNVEPVMLAAYALLKEYVGLDTDRTLPAMLYWQYINGFSNTMFPEFEHDKEALEHLLKRIKWNVNANSRYQHS